MDESQAKRAVKEYLEWEGNPYAPMRLSGVSGSYKKLWDALHDWANSPDEPDAELQEFKARMASVLGEIDWLLDGRGFGADGHFRKGIAAILAECEPPKLPKPKFAVDQVCRFIATGEFVTVREKTGAGYRVERNKHADLHCSENELRALTSEEIGPRP